MQLTVSRAGSRRFLALLAALIFSTTGAPGTIGAIGTAAAQQVAFSPTFSAPPDSVLIDGVRVAYAPGMPILVEAGRWFTLEAYRSGTWPIVERERFRSTEARRRYTFVRRWQYDVIQKASWTALPTTAIMFALIEPSEWDYYREAAGGLALMRAAYGVAMLQSGPTARHDSRFRLMLGWMQQDFTGMQSTLRATSTAPNTFVGSEGTVLEDVVTTRTYSGDVTYGFDPEGAHRTLRDGRLSGTRFGLSAQVAVSFGGRLGARLSYLGDTYDYVVLAGGVTRNRYAETRTAGASDATMLRHTVDAAATARVVTLLGNTIRVGAGPFVRIGGSFETEMPIGGSFSIGEEHFDQSTDVRIRGRADAAAGGFLLVSLETALNERLSFVTQYRRYHHLGDPKISTEILQPAGESASESLRHVSLWNSGFEIRL
jgi:hypothetical protein